MDKGAARVLSQQKAEFRGRETDAIRTRLADLRARNRSTTKQTRPLDLLRDIFGFYCIKDDDPEELEFFCHIVAQSEPAICVRCDQKVRLLKQIRLCAACSQAKHEKDNVVCGAKSVEASRPTKSRAP
jgi:hypothetical protein